MKINFSNSNIWEIFESAINGLACNASLAAVTRLTVYRQFRIYVCITFDIFSQNFSGWVMFEKCGTGSKLST